MTTTGEHASVGSVVRRAGVSLVIACVVPAVVFYTCFRIGGVGLAMGSALVWAYGAIAVRALGRARVSGMLLITATVLTVRTVVALAANSAFVYFLQPAISDGVLGAVFLASLLVRRPLTAKLAGDFYPMTDEIAACPRMQVLFARLGLCWSAYLLGKAVLIGWLLTHLSIPDFVRTMSMTNPTLNIAAAAATLALATSALRRAGHLGDVRPLAELEPVTVEALAA